MSFDLDQHINFACANLRQRMPGMELYGQLGNPKKHGRLKALKVDALKDVGLPSKGDRRSINRVS